MRDAPPPAPPDDAPALDASPTGLATNAYRDRDRLAPNDGAPPLGILADPAAPLSLVGIAYPYTHIGGVTAATGPGDDYPPPEVVWRLVLDRAWLDGRAVLLASKVTLDGRYVLRRGRFVELAEEAI